jgi:hypothetical protein
MDDFRRLVAGQDKFAKLVEDAMGPAYALSKQLQAVWSYPASVDG